MKNNVLKVILKWLICAVIIFLGFWFVLPPINPRSSEMWGFLIFCVVVCVVVNAFSQIISLVSVGGEMQDMHQPFRWVDMC